MSVTHIVLFQFKPGVGAEAIKDVSTRMLGLKENCLHPTSQKPYIISSSGGVDHSIENLQTKPATGIKIYYYKLSPSNMAKSATGPPLKILMLHGFTQSGPLFHAKSRALEKHIQKFFPSRAVTLTYPSAPITLDPSDIPNFSSSSSGSSTPQQPTEKSESFAWWRRADAIDPPEYVGINQGLAATARVLAEEGPFDGVIGFSQGACLAAMLASLLEPGRKDAFEYFSDPSNNQQPVQLVGQQDPLQRPGSQGKEGGKIATGIGFPASFAELDHPPLKFAVCYGGFIAPGVRYRGFYERPRIQTPVLHVLGSLDMVVEETRSRKLIEACAGSPELDGSVLWHPGGHFLPSQRPYLDGVVQFIKRNLESDGPSSKSDGDEAVENMEMPF
ncbi:hypothetical protein FQN57_004907 [Myotisia sp. PD_48]|nr:hypothetical protein FQN57_004907 [Myotisia sp. PD_48]